MERCRMAALQKSIMNRGLSDPYDSDSQDVEVVKHGISAIFADEFEQRDESTRLIVRSGSGKKLAAWNCVRRSCRHFDQVRGPADGMAARTIIGLDAATLELLDPFLDSLLR